MNKGKFIMQPEHLLFDMDGTLTPARQRIDPEFGDFLARFCKLHSCHIVTGSDYPKVREQLGEELCNSFHTIYACNGNTAYQAGKLVWQSEAASWNLNAEQCELIQGHIDKSKFWFRTGNHIEQRIGCANISVVGRNANLAEREQYIFWDQCNGERQKIVNKLSKRRAMNKLQFVLGGETGIDIFPQGNCKAQVRERLTGRALFIGDRCEPGGNDHTIAMVCDSFYAVRNWQETFAMLRERFPQ